MHQLTNLYLAALRSGDRALAAEADRSLRRLPRGPARWSAGAERTVRRILRRLT
jgi:hypothetical protein